MPEVTVFVDDAVQGRLPPMCAKTGGPPDGTLSLKAQFDHGNDAVALYTTTGLPFSWSI
ncbi:MAG TPA: hypothetical protein VGJ86_19405 [Acidimicrobiales bacterium]|jgi:hypothetical protein